MGYAVVLDVPVALALGAGMVATVNPCGFALLPAYLGFFVATDQDNRRDRLARALTVSAVMTAGFVTVFGVVGVAVQTVARGVDQHLSRVTVGVGLILSALGVWLLTGRDLRLGLPALRRGGRDRTLRSMYLFGVSYATASLSCTLGPFLVALTPTFRTSGTVAGLAAFVSYALGMGLVVAAATVAIAGAQGAVLVRLRRAEPLINRLSGVLLVAAGAYVAWYGWWELRGDFRRDPVVDAAQEVRDWLAARVDALPPGWIAAALGAASLAAVARRRIVGRRRSGNALSADGVSDSKPDQESFRA